MAARLSVEYTNFLYYLIVGMSPVWQSKPPDPMRYWWGKDCEKLVEQGDWPAIENIHGWTDFFIGISFEAFANIMPVATADFLENEP